MARKNKEIVTETAPVVNSEVANVLAEVAEQLTTNETVVATVEHKVTKAELGRVIFKEELEKGSARKDIINRLMTEAGLSKAGASTYLQNMKNKAGLVVHKAKVVATPAEGEVVA